MKRLFVRFSSGYSLFSLMLVLLYYASLRTIFLSHFFFDISFFLAKYKSLAKSQ